jgi:hypothetical protein
VRRKERAPVFGRGCCARRRRTRERPRAPPVREPDTRDAARRGAAPDAIPAGGDEDSQLREPASAPCPAKRRCRPSSMASDSNRSGDRAQWQRTVPLAIVPVCHRFGPFGAMTPLSRKARRPPAPSNAPRWRAQPSRRPASAMKSKTPASRHFQPAIRRAGGADGDEWRPGVPPRTATTVDRLCGRTGPACESFLTSGTAADRCGRLGVDLR